MNARTNKKALAASTAIPADEIIIQGNNSLTTADAYWTEAARLGAIAVAAGKGAEKANYDVCVAWVAAVKSGLIADTVENSQRWIRDANKTRDIKLSNSTIGVYASELRCWTNPAVVAAAIDYDATMKAFALEPKAKRGDKSPLKACIKVNQEIMKAVDEKRPVPVLDMAGMLALTNIKKAPTPKKETVPTPPTPPVETRTAEQIAADKIAATRAAFVTQTAALIELDDSIDPKMKKQLQAFIARFTPATTA